MSYNALVFSVEAGWWLWKRSYYVVETREGIHQWWLLLISLKWFRRNFSHFFFSDV